MPNDSESVTTAPCAQSLPPFCTCDIPECPCVTLRCKCTTKTCLVTQARHNEDNSRQFTVATLVATFMASTMIATLSLLNGLSGSTPHSSSVQGFRYGVAAVVQSVVIGIYAAIHAGVLASQNLDTLRLPRKPGFLGRFDLLTFYPTFLPYTSCVIGLLVSAGCWITSTLYFLDGYDLLMKRVVLALVVVGVFAGIPPALVILKNMYDWVVWLRSPVVK